MRIAIAGVVLLSLATALPVVAQSTATTTEAADQATTTQAPARPKESALVKAAKQSGTGTTPKMPKKVITNADVKKTKGKIATSTPKPIPAVSADHTVADPRGIMEMAEADAKARKAADDRIAAAKTKFDSLEKDLAAIEQAYYQERDPNVRDTVIQQRFAQTKRQLEAARKELADARDVRDSLAKR